MDRSPATPQPPPLLQQVRERLRTLHYSYRTEQSYLHWVRLFILFFEERHPRDMGKVEVERFLMYGAGLRVSECLRLRIGDLDFEDQHVVVRNGKGGKDRFVPLPQSLAEPLQEQIRETKRIRESDLADGFGEVSLPFALDEKYPSAPFDLGWWYVFPSLGRAIDPISRREKRHHMDPAPIQKAFKEAVRAAGLRKHTTPQRCGIRSRPTCWRPVTTSAQFRSCSAMGT